jgi:hypothetical protein
MKRLSAVAVALLIGVSSVSASWDYFPVIEQGSAEAKVGYGINDEGDNVSSGLKIRYGLIENMELFAATGAANCAQYTLGARYQIAPDMLSAFVDLGIPYTSGGDWGLTPGVQFSTNFTETISLGVGAQIPLHLNHPGAGDNGDDGLSVDLAVGLELDIALSEQVLFWVGVDFLYDELTNDSRGDLEIKSALSPAIGFTFSKDNLAVGTSLGIKLDAVNDKLEDSIGLIGGVDFSIKF